MVIVDSVQQRACFHIVSLFFTQTNLLMNFSQHKLDCTSLELLENTRGLFDRKWEEIVIHPCVILFGQMLGRAILGCYLLGHTEMYTSCWSKKYFGCLKHRQASFGIVFGHKRNIVQILFLLQAIAEAIRAQRKSTEFLKMDSEVKSNSGDQIIWSLWICGV